MKSKIIQEKCVIKDSIGDHTRKSWKDLLRWPIQHIYTLKSTAFENEKTIGSKNWKVASSYTVAAVSFVAQNQLLWFVFHSTTV